VKPVRREVQIDADGTTVPGILDLPAHATGLVLFAHGSGSSRHSPRNRLVAEVLVARGIGTLLLDLLTEAEGAQRDCVFDIELLGRRLEAAMRWVTAQAGAGRLPLGLFGASTGGAAALVAAARSPELVAAVVLRGGRPDLAGDQIPLVRAPTLLIVGGED
jgi:putative phosphoribosyl transferase